MGTGVSLFHSDQREQKKHLLEVKKNLLPPFFPSLVTAE